MFPLTIPTSLLSCLDWLLLSMLSTMPQSPTNTWTMQSAAPAKSAESYKAELRHIENTSINVTLLNLLYGLIYRLNKRVQAGTLLNCTRREPSQAIKLSTTLTLHQHHAPLSPLFKLDNRPGRCFGTDCIRDIWEIFPISIDSTDR